VARYCGNDNKIDTKIGKVSMKTSPVICKKGQKNTVSDGKKRTNAPLTPIRPLPGDSAPVGVTNTAGTRDGNGSHSRGGGGDWSARTHPP